MYEDVCYDEPVLKEAIVRVDFSGRIDALEKGVPPRVGKAILKSFPISEPKRHVRGELLFGQDKEPVVTQNTFTEWNYYGKDREKRLAISVEAAYCVHTQYTTFETFKADFTSVVDALFTSFPETTAGRVGVRYINHLTDVTNDPFEWDALIAPELLGLVRHFSQPDEVNRVFHIVEFRHDDLLVKFQFGLPNPDFPALMRRRLFVLDIDAYVRGALERQDIIASVDRAHERIQSLFETSITDELRQRMKVRAHAL